MTQKIDIVFFEDDIWTLSSLILIRKINLERFNTNKNV